MVSSETSKNIYSCDGIQTVFPITFDVALDDYGAAEGITVSREDTAGTVILLVKDTHYTVSGKNVTTMATYVTGEKISISRKNAILQQVGFIKNGKADLDVLENLFDRITFLLQEHAEKLGRTFLAPVTQSLIEDINEALKILINGDPDIFLTTLGVTDFIKTLIDDETSSAALSTLGFTAYAKTLIDDSDAATARGTLGIIDAVYPIGSHYTQFPNASSNDPATAFPSVYSPATLFGGTWGLLYSTEGIVFQTEGYNGVGRTNGLMEDQMQGFAILLNRAPYGTTGTTPFAFSNTTNVSEITYVTPSNDGTNGTPRTGPKTSHRNRLMRVYKRTA